MIKYGSRTEPKCRLFEAHADFSGNWPLFRPSLALTVRGLSGEHSIETDSSGVGTIPLEFSHIATHSSSESASLQIYCSSCTGEGWFANRIKPSAVTRYSMTINLEGQRTEVYKREVADLFAVDRDEPRIEDLQARGLHDPGVVSSLLEAMQSSGYTESSEISDFIQFLDDREKAQSEGVSPIQIRDRRIAEQQRREDERQRRFAEQQRRFAEQYPYVGIFSCSIYGRQVVFIYCFVDTGSRSGNTALRLEVDEQVRVFPGNMIPGFIEEFGTMRTEGIFVDLSRDFSIRMQNASDDAVLGLKIFERATGKTVYQNEVGRFGVISISN